MEFLYPKSKRQLIINIIENNNFKKTNYYFMNFLLMKKIKIDVIEYSGHWYEFDDFNDLKEYDKLISMNNFFETINSITHFLN